MFLLTNESNFLGDILAVGCIERSGWRCLAAFREAEAASGIALSDKPGLQRRKKTEETSGRASPRGVVRRVGASERNNVAEVDISYIGQTESERNLERERERKGCRALLSRKVKIIRKFLHRLLVESTKHGVTSKEPMGFRNFRKRAGNSKSGGILVYIFPL